MEKQHPAETKQNRKKGKRSYLPHTIQGTILMAFTIISFVLLMILGLVLYQLFARRMRTSSVESTEQIVQQSVINLEDYLANMRRISDAVYYNVIKNADLSTDSIDREMDLIYEAHLEHLVSMALFTADGRLISSSPIATTKENLDVTTQSWFTEALRKTDNLHFSTPHVENLFLDPAYRYRWVISLSRAVEIYENGTPTMGVLLVDMNYSTIDRMMERINQDSSGQYIYLTDSSGSLIYHPKQMQINYGILTENNINEAHYQDGHHQELYLGTRRQVLLNSVSYTGWKMIAVIPASAYGVDAASLRFVVILLVSISLLVMIFVNQIVSRQISLPLNRLNRSIKRMEGGDVVPEDIYVGGSEEVEHLGRTLRSSMTRINQLMDDIVIEQEEKRKSEMDALQSQINPHFLYNTLDSIVWMIEGEHNKDAVFMVTQLASLFRISLSRGKNIIPLAQELKHAENYMNIQKVRYKNNFSVVFDIDENIRDYLSVKLIIQPILENAIYYGVGDMDPDDGAEIRIRGWLIPDTENEKSGEGDAAHGQTYDAASGPVAARTARQPDPTEANAGDRAHRQMIQAMSVGDIYIAVSDNGYGMPPEVCENLLKDDEESRQRVPKHGSGVGLVNVHNRIRIRFGAQYGLMAASEPDEGTTITIHLPAIPDTPENQKLLESGHYRTAVSDRKTADVKTASAGNADTEDAAATRSDVQSSDITDVLVEDAGRTEGGKQHA
ncbi:sensor histidine kinase [Oribacterium sp. P9]|uniref:cache domain-containing sensor histidine kinase n=1 Tax=unclassified Oribacterium TaxID=2629782 RepID=UPI002A7B1175|nr:histidine kinase [Oribacterium sp.]MDY2855018.1 histidine kinase [Oliverpabstia sp.]